MKYLKPWIASFLTFFVLDAVLHMVVLGPYAQSQLSGVVRAANQIIMPLIMIEAVWVPTVIVFLLTQTGASSKPLWYSLKIGAILGLTVFGIYGIVNSAILPIWSTPIAIADAVVGAITFGAAGTAAGYFLKKSKKS